MLVKQIQKLYQGDRVIFQYLKNLNFLTCQYKYIHAILFHKQFLLQSLHFMQGFNQKQLDQLQPLILHQVKELEISGGWEQIADGNVKGYTKKSNTNSVITRAETIVNIAHQKLIDFFLKDDSFQKTNDVCILNKLVYQKKGKYKIFYIQTKTPFPLDNRDIVSMSTSINQGNKFYIGLKSCNYPVQKPNNFVRALMNISGWIFEKQDSNKTKVTSFADLDPMGNIPDFLKNSMATKRVQMMTNLQKTLKKHGY